MTRPARIPRARIDKSVLTFGEPCRIRDRSYCDSARGRSCMACGRQDSSVVLAHINIAGNFGRGLKASDDESVWLCGGCHAEQEADTDRADWFVRKVLIPLRKAAYQTWLMAKGQAR